MSGYALGILVLLSFNVIAAYAVYLPLAAGQLNLGIAGFMVIGAYTASYLTNEHGWPVAAAIACGGGLAAAVALVVAVPILRTHGIYLALATFALGQVIAAIFLNLDVVGGASGYPVTAHVEAHVVIWTTIGVVVFMALLSTTRFALYLTAVKSDPLVSDLMGINIRFIKVAAFTLGAAVAGIGGGLYAHYFNYIEPQYFSVMLSIYTVLYVLLGGTQTVWGPLIGAVIFTVMPELLRASAQWRYALFAVFIILFMAIRPQGLLTTGFGSNLRKLFARGEVAS
jgi:branched-chain amino acid transport system permease protein